MQFQTVQEVINSLRMANRERRQAKFFIDLRIIFIYTNGCGSTYRDIVVVEVPIPYQDLRTINITDYILNYLSESQGIAFNENLELSFLIEGQPMTITQARKKNSTIVKPWIGKKVKPTIALLAKDLVYINQIFQAVVIHCDDIARIKQNRPTRRSGHYPVMLHEVTLRLNKYITAITLSYEPIVVGSKVNVIISSIFENGKIQATQIYSPQVTDESMFFNRILKRDAIEMSRNKIFKDLPVGQIIPANVIHFKKITNYVWDWFSPPEIPPPKQFVLLRRRGLEAPTYPAYYEYIVELLGSKIVLKGSSLCEPILDQVFKTVEQEKTRRITMVNVKVKSMVVTGHRGEEVVRIDFFIESLHFD